VAQASYLRWGLIGLGSGASNLLEGFGRNPHVRVTAACDVRKDAVEAFARQYDAEPFTSAEELCKSPNVDAVWVATPNHLHAEHVILAVNHGKHATVSKPMAISLEECEAMNEAAERNGVVLLCGHTQAMQAPIHKMAELVWSGQYGRLGMVHSWNYTDWIYRPRMPYELDVSQGGGAVYRQSPHHIDIVRLIGGGLVRSVRAMTLEIDPRRPAPGGFVVFLQFEDGVPSTIVYNGYGHFETSEITFGGRVGIPTVSRDTTPEEEAAMKESRRYTATAGSGNSGGPERARHTAFGFTIASCEKADIRQSPNGLWIYDESGKHELEIPKEQSRGEAEFEEMYQAVVEKKRVIHDGRWGEATHEVTLAIMESARTGKDVVLSHQVPVPPELLNAAR
jgi:phthalate 4,5-cis-dihydrodiol dehydrogenase